MTIPDWPQKCDWLMEYSQSSSASSDAGWRGYFGWFGGHESSATSELAEEATKKLNEYRAQKVVAETTRYDHYQVFK